MRARRGQIVVYLVAVLVAIAVLAVMNASVFLSVRSKNCVTNAGDAAALAVAKLQGELINEIGRLNVEHMRAALRDDLGKCGSITQEQMRICLLRPLDGIPIGNDAARLNGVEKSAEPAMLQLLLSHAAKVRNEYPRSPELYPEPYEGAWREYADKLESVLGDLGGGLVAGPDNISFFGAVHQPPLVDEGFYDAIDGCDWCWFYGCREYLFDCDHTGMPYPDYTASRSCYNSEIYSLALDFQAVAARSAEWRETVKAFTGCSDADFDRSCTITNETQVWAVYGTKWRKWYEISPPFPVRGEVRPEYDVLGCAAACRVCGDYSDLVNGGTRTSVWMAAAKPFGAIDDLEGERSPVTACMNLVKDKSFTDVRLVPYDSVAFGNCFKTSDVDWMRHVSEHLDDYISSGPKANGCRYCTQLIKWENPAFRAVGKRWLKFNWESCRRPTYGGSGRGGGARYGH